MPIHLRKYYFQKALDRQKPNEETPEALGDKIKAGHIQVPNYSKGRRINY